MKRISVLAIALFSVSLAQSGVAQSTPQTAPATTTKDQAKQDKQAEKAKAKANKGDSKAQSGKKTTTSQDAAYALAYKHGTTESSAPPK
jgi:GH24 family phage-related lysozyme (muramidase)